MSETSSDSANVRGFRFQFSIRTILLLVAIIAVGVSIWHSAHQANENAWLKRANGELRQKLGELDIQEGRERYLHISAQWESNPLAWSWKVYSPPGRRLRLHIGTGQISVRDTPRENVSVPIPDGESVISVTLRNSAAGKWVCSANTELGADQVPFADEVPEPKLANRYSSANFGFGGTTHTSASDPLKLFYFEVGRPLPGLGDRLTAWISEEAAPKK